MVSLRFAALIAVGAIGAFGLLASPARADDEDPSFNFKLPDKAKSGPDNKPGGSEADDRSDVVPTTVRLEIDYPRFDGYVALNPGYIGLNQVGTASGLVFNVGQYSPVSFVAGGKVDFTQRVSLEANLGYSQFSTPAQTLTYGIINASTANMIVGNVDGYYCFNLGVTGLKVCPGTGLGVDGFPVFQFTDVSNVQINSFADMIVRGLLKIQYPIGANTTVWLTGNYDYGFLKGATGGIATTSHHSLGGSLGFKSPLTFKTDLLLAVSLDSISSGFSTSAGTIDTWTATTTMVSLTGGISYRF